MLLISVVPLVVGCSKKNPTNQKDFPKVAGKTTLSPSGKKTPKSTSGKLETNAKIVELAKQKNMKSKTTSTTPKQVIIIEKTKRKSVEVFDESYPEVVEPTPSMVKKREKQLEESRKLKIKQGFYQSKSDEDDTLESIKSLKVEKSDDEINQSTKKLSTNSKTKTRKTLKKKDVETKKQSSCVYNTTDLIKQMQTTQRDINSFILEHFAARDQRFKAMIPLIKTAMSGFRCVLQPFELKNTDETKYFLKLLDPWAPCNFVTLGVGHDWEVEKKMQQKYPQCQFLGVDPIEENRKLVEAEPNSRFIHAAVAATNKNKSAVVYGGEFELLKVLHDERAKLPIICQYNVEIHYKFKLVPLQWENIYDKLDLLFKESHFIALKIFALHNQKTILTRVLFVNVGDRECVQKFIG
ncbi:hypothetical protein M3Y96_00184600 [Aphelenchoides besseyi]|nr:hypothetical protein M3Y96_00184600 [Aphelenchoides besseyi]